VAYVPGGMWGGNRNARPIAEPPDPALYLLLFANAANEQQIDPGELKKIVLSFAQ